jgi:hypothetical protein
MRVFNKIFLIGFLLTSLNILRAEEESLLPDDLGDLSEGSAESASSSAAPSGDAAPSLGDNAASGAAKDTANNVAPKDTSQMTDDELFADQDKNKPPEVEEDPPVAENKTDSSLDPNAPKQEEITVERENGQFAGLNDTGEIIEPDEPGSKLEPSDKFSRVPLRPPMSDRGWRKYAGPAVEKVYKVKEGDSLWSISERLFGNPHIWPKIWQLNAKIGNAHNVYAGTELLFTPGNPYAAPMLAFKNYGKAEDEERVPLTGHIREPSTIDRIREALSGNITGVAQFRNYMVIERPEAVAKLPKRKDDSKRLIYEEGARLSLPKVQPGRYAIVRVDSVEAHGRKHLALTWLGRMEVTPFDSELNFNNALVEKTFEEIYEGDLVVKRDFGLKHLPLHTEILGRDRRDETRFVPLDSNYKQILAQNVLMGAKFKNSLAGPQLGAIVNILRGGERIGTAVLIDRFDAAGTFWIVDADRELDVSDIIE